MNDNLTAESAERAEKSRVKVEVKVKKGGAEESQPQLLSYLKCSADFADSAVKM